MGPFGTIDLVGRLRAAVRRHRLAPLGALSLLAVLTACASSGEGSARVDQGELGFEELQSAGVSNAYDAVQRLRPAWLRSRGPRSTGIAQMETQIVVSLNGSYYGDVETLRQFPIDDVEALSYVDGTAAPTAVSGVGPGIHVEAAIIVRLRGR